MRRYDDPVEVRRGMVDGTEGPEQFLWRGRLWKVHSVLAHWVETAPWWDSSAARAALGTAGGSAGGSVGGSAGGSGGGSAGEPVGAVAVYDLAAEREVWRVEASRGRLALEGGGGGVFDLVFDWAAGSWRLARCAD